MKILDGMKEHRKSLRYGLYDVRLEADYIDAYLNNEEVTILKLAGAKFEKIEKHERVFNSSQW